MLSATQELAALCRPAAVDTAASASAAAAARSAALGRLLGYTLRTSLRPALLFTDVFTDGSAGVLASVHSRLGLGAPPGPQIKIHFTLGSAFVSWYVDWGFRGGGQGGWSCCTPRAASTGR